MKNAKPKFNGPLFVIGMSRSGTKLLMNILNNSPEICIPSSESHFIPYLVENFSKNRFPLNKRDKNKLKYILTEGIFYHEVKRETKEFDELHIDSILKAKNVQEVIENTIRQTSKDQSKKDATIWGDKTPNNLLHICLLKKAFPEAKFVHIIRDPRERALSAHKAWGANMYLSADRWRRSVESARRQGQAIGADYIEVQYEKLVNHPEKEVEKVCTFLNIRFSNSLLYFEDPLENHNTAGSKTNAAQTIVKNNTEKFRTEVSSDIVKRMEMIASPTIIQLGYSRKTSNNKEPSLSKNHRKFLMAQDYVRSVMYHMRRWGVWNGLRFVKWRSIINKVGRANKNDNQR
ncbi:MAG: sulfotransferase [Candidatus Saccharibacteria bacterium]|nr:sulfotransferase [Candidatus Saccharibacteria bacterium]